MIEIWKPIDGYESYSVSSLGRIKSTKQWHGTSERILRCGISKKGYSIVALCNNGKSKSFTVHRLVAKAFIPNPNNYDQINHINENKTDNRMENLEWCDGKYNMNYGTRTAKQIAKRSKPVMCIESNTIFKSSADAARKLNLNQGNIHNCCTGRNKTCGGFHWKFV